MNLAALLVSIMPVLQFVALFLAIVVSITTIIINYQKFKKK
jgi:ABC-type multidrug transport system permease subunit